MNLADVTAYDFGHLGATVDVPELLTLEVTVSTDPTDPVLSDPDLLPFGEDPDLTVNSGSTPGTAPPATGGIPTPTVSPPVTTLSPTVPTTLPPTVPTPLPTTLAPTLPTTLPTVPTTLPGLP